MKEMFEYIVLAGIIVGICAGMAIIYLVNFLTK